MNCYIKNTFSLVLPVLHDKITGILSVFLMQRVKKTKQKTCQDVYLFQHGESFQAIS